jgi:imidazolonepropionase-like amidohydrolase
MVARRWILGSLACLALGACNGRMSVSASGPMKLQGFTVLDVARQEAKVRDLWIVDGKIASTAPVGSESWPVMDGRGRWLLPTFWDMQIASWGNLSSKDYWILEQHMGQDTLAKALLYAGVGHAFVGSGNGAWFQRGVKKSRIMQLTGAELMRSSRLYCGPMQDSPGGITISSVAAVDAFMKKEKDQQTAFMFLSLSSDPKSSPPLSREVFAAFVKQSHQAGMPVVALVSSSAEGRQAINGGAQALMSSGVGKGSAELFRLMAAKKIAWIPLLASALDIAYLNGPDGVLADPMAKILVRQEIIDDFKDTPAYGPATAHALQDEAKKEPQLLADLAQAQATGVGVLAATLAGSAPGSFQGLSLHRQLQWMVKGGLSPWQALATATVAPEQWLGRPIGLVDGAPADLLVLDADPTADIHNTERISAVCVDGRWANRERLKPDLWRRMF